MQTVKLRHPDGTETNVVKGVMMLEAADLVPTFPDHFFAQGKSKEEAVSATQPAAQGEPAAQPENTVTQSESNSVQSENTAAQPENTATQPENTATQPENTATQPDEGAELSSLVPPRSFASLQLRAKNATKALFAQKREHLLVLCSDTSVAFLSTGSMRTSMMESERYAPPKSPVSSRSEEPSVPSSSM